VAPRLPGSTRRRCTVAGRCDAVHTTPRRRRSGRDRRARPRRRLHRPVPARDGGGTRSANAPSLVRMIRPSGRSRAGRRDEIAGDAGLRDGSRPWSGVRDRARAMTPAGLFISR
jgi:hypothetical protein